MAANLGTRTDPFPAGGAEPSFGVGKCPFEISPTIPADNSLVLYLLGAVGAFLHGTLPLRGVAAATAILAHPEKGTM
jgi:hypothetical protein